jgi:hypothetical protein
LLLVCGKRSGGAHDGRSDFPCIHGIDWRFAGLALVVAPQLQNSVIKPYFWILIAVGLFDGGNYLLGRTAAGQMVTMGARLAGFVIGVVVMVAIPTITGTPVKFF